MSLPFSILNKIDTIKKDRHHGARELTYMSLQLLKRCLEDVSNKEREKLTAFLLDVAKAFAEARPSMASIANSMASIAHRVLEEKAVSKASIINIVDNQLTQLETSFQKVIENTAKIIVPESTVITCSYSSTIHKALVEAQKRDRQLQVVIIRSPSPNGSIRYDKLLKDKLSAAEITANVVPEKKLETHLESVDSALVGADSIYPDGSILNGTPTLLLAKEAAQNDKPFYVACETWKINPLSLLGATPTIERGLDRAPSDLITAIITEKGATQPTIIYEYAKQFVKYLKVLFPNRR